MARLALGEAARRWPFRCPEAEQQRRVLPNSSPEVATTATAVAVPVRVRPGHYQHHARTASHYPERNPLMSLHSITSPAHRLAEAVSLPPSERPAHELPEYEPTAAELAALEFSTDDQFDDHLARVTTFCAIEQHRRDLLDLRDALGVDGLPDEIDEAEVAEQEPDLSLTGRCAA